jgi:hypothetical protein
MIKLESAFYTISINIRLFAKEDLRCTHAEKLFALQKRLNKNVSEIIADLIDASWRKTTETSIEAESSALYQAFNAAGLIGCITTDEELSTSYKDKMDFSNKTGKERQSIARRGL